jgi:protein-ribulosamine 3-kinase
MIGAFTGIIEQELSRVLHATSSIVSSRKLSGGSINEVYQVITDTGNRFCCKLNLLEGYPKMFEAEATGLALLRKPEAIRIPEVICTFNTGSHQVLVLEWIEPGNRSPFFWKDFGKQLSLLHQVSGEQFGLGESNYMGALAQTNVPSPDWSIFFYQRRIRPQVQLALEKRLLTPAQAKLFERLPHVLPYLFSDAAPRLVHGDLWSGNFLCDADEQPVLIDPAAYYGHPAVDLAMTTLFGGFDKTFYESYNYYSPFPDNYREQWECCNLYPLLIHLNLFGQSYLGDILRIIGRY